VLRVTVWHTNPEPIDIRDVQVYHAEDEALLDAGELFQPAFLDSLRGAARLRMSIWMNAASAGLAPMETELPSVEIGYFGQESDRVPLCPPSLLAKLAQKTGAEIWVNFPAKASAACMRAYAEGMKAAGYPSGVNVVCEAGGLEPWNFAYPYVIGAKWIASRYPTSVQALAAATPPSEGVRTALGVADMSLTLWREFEAVFGANTVRVFCGQGAWPDRFASAFGYVDPQTGRRFADLMHEYSVSLYLRLTAGGEVASTKQADMKAERAHEKPDSWWKAAMLNGLPVLKGHIDANRAFLPKQNPAIRFGTYECGNEYFFQWERVAFTLDPAAQHLVSSIPVDRLFATGEQAIGEFGRRPSSKLSAYAEPRAFVRVVDGANAITLHATRDDALAGANPLPLDGADSVYKLDNFTRVEAMDRRVKALLDSDFGAELYRQLFDLMEGAGVVAALHHCDTANYWIGQTNGLKRSQYDPDTPRAALFRALAAKET
jgi:hypothetical protein